MKVAKWKDSLVIQIPSSVVDELELKEGDDVSVRISHGQALRNERDDDRMRALEKIKSFKIRLPNDWEFNRDDANSR